MDTCPPGHALVANFADFLGRAVPSATTRTAAPRCRASPTTGTISSGDRAGPAAVRAVLPLPARSARASITGAPTGDLAFIEFTPHADVGRHTLAWPTVNRLLLRDGKAIERMTYFDPLAVLPTLPRHPSAWWQWLTR